MNGIVINIDPVIFHMGISEFRWYSLAVMLAIVVAVLMAARFGEKKESRPEKSTPWLFGWCLLVWWVPGYPM